MQSVTAEASAPKTRNLAILKVSPLPKLSVDVDLTLGIGEDHSCSCHQGANCVCTNKTEAQELRLETSLGRPTHPVKSKPKLGTSNSENILTVFANGHHKPCHRNNNLAHTSGAPYRIPRPHTLHGALSFAQATRDNAVNEVFGGSVDDLLLLSSENGNRVYNTTPNVQDSAESLDIPIIAGDIPSFDVKLLPTDMPLSPGNVSSENLATDSAAVLSWYDSTMNTAADSTADFLASPNFCTMSELEWGIPSASSEFFSPADLPLNSNPSYSEYVQPVSHSGESNYQSAPGLTAPSSGTPSETGETAYHADQESSTGFWTDNVTFREPDPYRMSQASIYDSFSYPPATAADSKPQQSSSGFGFDASQNQPSQSLGEMPNMAEGDVNNNDNSSPQTERAIIIPAGLNDAKDSWYFPVNTNANAVEQSREYSWLLDGA